MDNRFGITVTINLSNRHLNCTGSRNNTVCIHNKPQGTVWKLLGVIKRLNKSVKVFSDVLKMCCSELGKKWNMKQRSTPVHTSIIFIQSLRKTNVLIVQIFTDTVLTMYCCLSKKWNKMSIPTPIKQTHINCISIKWNCTSNVISPWVYCEEINLLFLGFGQLVHWSQYESGNSHQTSFRAKQCAC